MLQRFLQNESGIAVVEMALAMPVFCALLLGVYDLGRMAYWQCAVADTTHTGAEYGSISAPLSTSTITDAMTRNLNAAIPQGLSSAGVQASASYYCVCSNNLNAKTNNCGPTKTITCGSGAHELHYVSATVSLKYKPIFSNVLQNATYPMDSTTVMQVHG